jgi:hypothetical protein
MASYRNRRGPALRVDFGCISGTSDKLVMAAAEECDVELLSLPAGGTNECQSFGYCVFAELKSRAKAEITRLMAICGAVNIN